MTDRRFHHHAHLDPRSVAALPASHPAMVEGRTLFPSTVVDITADNPDRLLVSGTNNRKLGGTIARGAFAGYALYGFSLEERATCPVTCSVRGFCYGNGMQMARRHRIVDLKVFVDRLHVEVAHLLREHPQGVMVRLHVLGDFPSVPYVTAWTGLLDIHDRLACYGYTHWLPRRKDSAIGDAIAKAKQMFPDRFRIRWSSDTEDQDAATVINYVPRTRPAQGIVCPAQTHPDACCASCTLCWEPKSRNQNIVFILHGKTSAEAAARNAMADIEARQPPALLPAPVRLPAASPAVTAASPAAVVLPASSTAVAPLAPRAAATRPIAGITMPGRFQPNDIDGVMPEVRLVAPTELRVEPAYQRDLSGRSVKLIRKIVTGWSWAKFKAPICAETSEGLFVIDGQHTAIAAASHPAIDRIPVMVVGAEQIEARADAFVAHNRDRLAMSALQIFHAEVAAGGKEALSLAASAKRAGATIPRSPPSRHDDGRGQVVAITEARRILHSVGPAFLERLLRIAVLSNVDPIAMTILRALWMLLTLPYFDAAKTFPDAEIARAVASLGNVESRALIHAGKTGQGKYRAAAVLILDALKASTERAA